MQEKRVSRPLEKGERQCRGTTGKLLRKLPLYLLTAKNRSFAFRSITAKHRGFGQLLTSSMIRQLFLIVIIFMIRIPVTGQTNISTSDRDQTNISTFDRDQTNITTNGQRSFQAISQTNFPIHEQTSFPTDARTNFLTTGQTSNTTDRQSGYQLPGGNGTEADPYLVSNAGHLAWMAADNTTVTDISREERWSSHYRQIDDIDFALTGDLFGDNGWIPAGNSDIPFSGSYHGGGHTIDNLTIDNETDYNGLFGNLTGHITDLGLEAVNINGGQYTGGIAGYNGGGITGCYTTGNITGSTQVGGITGYNHNGTVSNSYSTVNVSGTQHTGGLIGLFFGGTVTHCYAAGEVGGNPLAGGLFGGFWTGSMNASCKPENTLGEGIPLTEEQMRSSEMFIMFGWNFEERWVTDQEGVKNGGYPYLRWQSFRYAWEGGVSGIWSDSANWVPLFNPSLHALPGPGDKLIIPGNSTHQPIIDGQLKAKQVTIESGASLTLSSGRLDITPNDIPIEGNTLPAIKKYDTPSDNISLDGFVSGDGSSNKIILTDHGQILDNRTDTDSETGSYLSGGTISSRITIDGDLIVMEGGVLEVEDGSSLTVNSGGTITSTGTIINNGGPRAFTIKSGPESSGSLISETPILDGRGEQPIPGRVTFQLHLDPQKLQLITPPVTLQSVDTFLQMNNNVATTVDGGETIYALACYHEQVPGEEHGGWSHFYRESNPWGAGPTNPEGELLETGRGYLIGINPGVTNQDNYVSFTGYPATANPGNITITRRANGWNAVGNPFTSALALNSNTTTAENFLNSNAGKLDENYLAIYLHDPAINNGNGGYHVINNVPVGNPGTTVNYLKPGQGFIVKASSTTQPGEEVQLHFIGEMCTHAQSRAGEHNSYSYSTNTNSTPWSIFHLTATCATQDAGVVLAFNSNMTTGLDPGYDAGTFGDDPSFRFYTRLPEEENDVDLAIQALPVNGLEEMVIPLGIDMDHGGEVTFSLTGDDLFSGGQILLEDRAVNHLINLMEKEYKVQLPSGSKGTGRFFIHHGNQITQAEEIPGTDQQEIISIYASRRQIIVEGEIPPGSIAELYNISGGLLKTVSLSDMERNSIGTGELRQGIYIVRVILKSNPLAPAGITSGAAAGAAAGTTFSATPTATNIPSASGNHVIVKRIWLE